jgi:hypothetical protein
LKREKKPNEVSTEVREQCNSSRVAFGVRIHEPHPMGRPWGNCWLCKQSLGCSSCTTPTAREVLCARCAAWGTKDAFHHHGPIMNDEASLWKRRGLRAPQYREYPDEWKVGYEVPQLAVASLGELIRVATGERNG